MLVPEIQQTLNQLNAEIGTFVAVQQKQWEDQRAQWDQQVQDIQQNVKKASDEAVGNFVTKIQDLVDPKKNDVTWDESEPWVDEPWEDDLEDLDEDFDAIDEPDMLMGVPSTTIGGRLASKGLQMAKKFDSIGRCYAAVADAVDATVAVFLWGSSAYQAADQFAARRDFKEYSISASGLKSLPAGAIVVWGKTGASPHGHISIASGNGQEYSDHVEVQRTQLRGYTNFRVFMPLDGFHQFQIPSDASYLY